MMFLIYEPLSLESDVRESLERALDRDRARILYAGNDGQTEYVIVEARSFDHTRRIGSRRGLPLAFQGRVPATG